MSQERHTFAVYMEDKPGVLNRVASLFRRRVFNIVSLAVGRAEFPEVSRMTVVVETNAGGARRLEANLYKLVNVLHVQDITDVPAVFRELVMIKVSANAETRAHIVQIVDLFRGSVLDVAPGSLVVEATGKEEKIEGLLELLKPFGILELVRTGRVGIARGATSVTIASDQVDGGDTQLSPPDHRNGSDESDDSHSV